MNVYRAEMIRLVEEHEKLDRKLRIVNNKLETWKLEHNEELWGPISDEVKVLLGVKEAPPMSYNFDEQEITLTDKQERKQDIKEVLTKLGEKIGLGAPPDAVIEMIMRKANGEEGDGGHECDDCGECKDKDDKKLLN